MKNIVLSWLLLLSFFASFAQGTEYVGRTEFQSETKKIKEGVQSSRKSVTELQKTVTAQENLIDSLQNQIGTLIMQNSAVTDSFANTTKQLDKLEAGISNYSGMLYNGVLIIGILFLLFITAAFFYIRMVAVKAGKRSEEISDLFAVFSQNTEKDILMIRAEQKETHEHILYLSDELKEYRQQIEGCLDKERERSAMLEEKIKNVSLESEINHKVNREKILTLHKETEKQFSETEAKVMETFSKIEGELTRLSAMIRPGKEKEEVA